MTLGSVVPFKRLPTDWKARFALFADCDGTAAGRTTLRFVLSTTELSYEGGLDSAH